MTHIHAQAIRIHIKITGFDCCVVNRTHHNPFIFSVIPIIAVEIYL
ncbi:MAG: hypothetical protein KF908_07150 [Nitrosomonas sp.]|nr:hypothetical protein [Nitrosomonas sp.]MBX3641356.1 hypothetical protein [Nitrosomonas sp.]MCW5607000.1 hypothetical protein [Nitrosomonas sp.]